MFLHLWSNAHRIDVTRGGLLAFVVTVARSRAIDMCAVKNAAESANSGRRVQRCWGMVRRSSPTSATMSSPVILSKGAADVQTALRDLPEAQRIAIDLAYFHGHSFARWRW